MSWLPPKQPKRAHTHTHTIWWLSFWIAYTHKPSKTHSPAAVRRTARGMEALERRDGPDCSGSRTVVRYSRELAILLVPGIRVVLFAATESSRSHCSLNPPMLPAWSKLPGLPTRKLGIRQAIPETKRMRETASAHSTDLEPYETAPREKQNGPTSVGLVEKAFVSTRPKGLRSH